MKKSDYYFWRSIMWFGLAAGLMFLNGYLQTVIPNWAKWPLTLSTAPIFVFFILSSGGALCFSVEEVRKESKGDAEQKEKSEGN